MHLVQVDGRAEQRVGLSQLTFEHGQGVVLDLMGVGIQPPPTRVRIPPLRPDHGPFVAPAAVQPRRQELLGPAVGTRDVDVGDARVPRGVEHLGGPATHRVDVVVAVEVVGVPEVDVGRAPQRSEADAHPRDGQARPTEFPVLHGRAA